MHQKLKPLFVSKKLKEKNLTIFTPLDFKRVFSVSDYATQWFIKTYTQKGLFIKLRNGLYALADYLPSQYLIANRLYEPSYISFDTALSFYQIIPETIYEVTSATTRTTREFEANKIRFTFHKIKKTAFTGYKATKYLGNTILIAEPEKALADYLYFVDLRKRSLSYERLDLKSVKKTKLLKYARLFKRPGISKLINLIYAQSRRHQRIY